VLEHGDSASNAADNDTAACKCKPATDRPRAEDRGRQLAWLRYHVDASARQRMRRFYHGHTWSAPWLARNRTAATGRIRKAGEMLGPYSWRVQILNAAIHTVGAKITERLNK
jgi:hypothetical protein